MVNIPDGLWNRGEGFRHPGPPGVGSADYGGWHGFDDGAQLRFEDIVLETTQVVQSPRTPARSTIAHKGYLVPANAPNREDIDGEPVPAFAAETAFEIFHPEQFVPRAAGGKTVILVATWGTLFSSRERYQYPGSAALGGLLPSQVDPNQISRPLAFPYVVGQSGVGGGVANLNIIGCYIVSPTPARDLCLTLQRTLQIERAVRALLNEAVPTQDPLGVRERGFDWSNQQIDEEIPSVVTGGSAGGQVSILAATLFPDRFQGAMPVVFSGSVRRTVGDQEAHAYYTLSTVAVGSQAMGPWDNLTWGKLYRELGADYDRGSYLSLWKQGFAVHPMLFVLPDEDTVTNGTEWLTVLGGGRGSFAHGKTIAGTPPIYWSILDATCHDTNYAPVPPGLSLPYSSTTAVVHEDLILGLLPTVAGPGATPPSRPDFCTPGVVLPNADVDPFDHELARKTRGEREAAARARLGDPLPTCLAEVESFSTAHNGLGMALGHEGALAVDPSSATIYVGGIDGVVSALKLTTAAPPNHTRLSIALNALGQRQQTQSLGHAVRGLVVDGGGLIVATYRRLYRLDRSDLRAAPQQVVDLPWDELRPSELTIAKLFGSDWLLLYKTYLGELVARHPGNLASVACSVSEPGIRAYVVGPESPDTSQNVAYSRPVYIASDRGHVLGMRISQTPQPVTTPCGGTVLRHVKRLTALSRPMEGSPLDLLCRSEGYLTALYHAPGVSRSIREFPLSMAPDLRADVEYSTAGNDASGSWDRIGRIERFGAGYVTVTGATIRYIVPQLAYEPEGIKINDPSLFTQQSQPISPFPAAVDPLAIAVLDVDGAGGPDLVLATGNGQVAWIPGADVMAGNVNSFQAARAAGDPFAYSSASTVATWGLTMAEDGGVKKLLGVDQVGRICDFKNGAPVHLADVTWSTKPFRDLMVVKGLPVQGVTDVMDGQYAVLQIDGVPVGALGTNLQVQGVERGSTFTYLPLNWTPPELPSGSMVQWRPRTHFMGFRPIGGLFVAPAPFGASVLDSIAGDTRAYWWSGLPLLVPGLEYYSNLVQELRIRPQLTPPLATWASTSRPTPNARKGTHLRNVVNVDYGYDQQSLRAAYWPEGGAHTRPYVVCTSSGGGILVLDPLANVDGGASCLKNAPTDDAGFGGMALCVSRVTGLTDTRPRIFSATLFTHADVLPQSTDMVSSLQIHDFDPGATPSLSRTSFAFDLSAAGKPRLFGICGLAVGDLCADATSVPEELVVTTLGGDLAVFDLVADGSAVGIGLGALLHYEILDGVTGAFNALVIADLDESSGAEGPELYVGTSFGVRKFTRVMP